MTPSGTSWTPACAVRPKLATRRFSRVLRLASYGILRATLALLFGVLLLQSPPSPAAPPSVVVTVATGVSPEATAENSQRKLVGDPAGGLFLTYVRPVQGNDQVFLAESGDRGRTWRAVQVTQALRPARYPSLAIFPDGSLHLVWTEYAPIGRILYRVWRGGRWVEPVNLSTPGVYAGIPVVAPVAGRAHVLWYGILPERPAVRTRHGSVYEILFTRREGQGWTKPLVISPGVPDSINPALAADSAGRLHAAWYQFDGRVYQIRYAVFDGRWSLPRTLTGGPAEHTAVALETAGREVHLVWVEHGAARRLVHLRLGDAPLVLAAGSVHDPVIATGGGQVAAAWRQEGTIMFRPIRPAGPARALGSGSGVPALAIFRGTAFAAWTAIAGKTNEVRFITVPLR